MNSDERKDIVQRAARRISSNLEKLTGYSRIDYLMKLVNMLDDTHLTALDFAIDMTPDQKESEGEHR